MEYIDAKHIVIRTKNSSWFGTDYNMNIYRGCCHGCIYCDSRSNCYCNTDFDIVKAKKDALRVIRDDLSKKKIKGVIGAGAMSDPYNPFEKKHELTRNSLELINAFGFGVAIDTKSPLITRDTDILCDIKKHSPVICKFSITTANEDLCKIIEPNVSTSKRRFEAMNLLANNKIYTGTLLMPILPYINDTKENILSIVRQTKENGGNFIYAAFGVTLRDTQRKYFYSKLDEHFPNCKEKYMRHFGERYSCSSPYARNLYGILANECEKIGLFYKMREITINYKKGYEYKQLSFLIP